MNYVLFGHLRITNLNKLFNIDSIQSEWIQKVLKIGIGIGLIAILASAQLNPGFLPMTKPNCLEDNFFVWTKDLNN